MMRVALGHRYMIFMAFMLTCNNFAYSHVADYWQQYKTEISDMDVVANVCNSIHLMGVAYGFDLAKKHFSPGLGVKHVVLITPSKKIPDKKIIILTIKGTWAGDDDDCRAGNKVFTGFLKFATDIAHTKQCAVELVAFTWQAHNNHKSRMDAADQLAALINLHYDDVKEYLELYIIGHSHGGSVANAATNVINREVTELLNFATPILAYDEYKPVNYKRCCQFYSECDTAQWIGSGKRILNLRHSPRRFIRHEVPHDRAFHAVFVKIHGQAASHNDIKLFSYQLAPFLERLTTTYENQTNLVANLILNPKRHKTTIRCEAAKKHPLLIAPYRKHTGYHQRELIQQEALTHDAQIFQKLYRGDPIGSRNLFAEFVNNVTATVKELSKKIRFFVKYICNPKLVKIPGS